MVVKHYGTRHLHDLLVNPLSEWLRRAKTPHMGGGGGCKRTCTGLFTEFANQLNPLDPSVPADAKALRYRQRTTADLRIDATSIDLPGSKASTPGDRSLADMKALALGTKYPESTAAAFSPAVEKR